GLLSCRRILRRLDLPPQEPAAHTRQPQVMVARQPLQRQEPARPDRRGVGGLEKRRPPVHLLEQRHVDHRRPGFLRLAELLPQELAPLPWDLIKRRLGPHVVPAEAREHHRQVVLALALAPLAVFLPPLLSVVRNALERAVAADCPGT